MAVLVEGISVIARRDRLDELFPGGSEQYIADCPNATACADNYLVRIGFFSPDEVRGFVRRLESLGFVHLDGEGKAQDLVVVDQLRGPTSQCDWVEYGHVEIRGHRVAIARLMDDPSTTMAAPMDWAYEGSLTHKHVFVNPDARSTVELLALANQRRELGDTQAARARYEHIAAKSPDTYPALHELAVLELAAAEYQRAADTAERSLQAFARAVLRELAKTNSFQNACETGPTLATAAWSEVACYAAMYSTATESAVGAFVVPTPESARAEADSREHGGLYWFDADDADGVRSRHFMPNFFNAFFHRCIANPLYAAMLAVRGQALRAIGDGAADELLAEAAAVANLLAESGRSRGT